MLSKKKQTVNPGKFKSKIEGINYGLLDSLVGYSIRRGQISFYDDFFKAVNEPSITPLRFSTLVIIGANPGLRQVQISDLFGVARPGATSLIDYWEKKGCVERRVGDKDRRSYGIYLTKKGSEDLENLQNIVKAHEDHMTRNLSNSERETLMDLLKKIYSEA